MAYFHLLEDWKVIYAPRTPEDEVDSQFTEACHNLPQVEYWVDVLLSDDSYERAEVIDRMTADGKMEKLQEHLKKHRKGWSYERD